MNYEISLNLLQYVVVLIAFGVLGSCYQAYRVTTSIRPFVARVITGSFAGAVTMLVVYKLDMQTLPPILHWGVATVLGAFLEKKDEKNIIEKLILKLSK